MVHYTSTSKERLVLQANFSIGQRENIQTNFIASQPQEVQADLSINVTPSKVSQLENDVPYLTSADIEGITEDITELQGDVTDLGNNKQDTLISGENIKTINDTSILGSGNIEIDLSDYATTQDLVSGLATKQDILTQGSGINLYQKAKYIQNDTDTRVSTGIYITNDDFELDIVFYCKSRESLYLFQARTSANSNIFGISGSQSGGTITISINGSSITSNISRTTGHIYHINAKFVSENATLFVEDLTEQTSATNTGTYTFGTLNKDLNLFGSGVSGQTLSAGYHIYSAYAKQDGEYLLNYVPAVYNNEPCFYDTISNSFKGATTGSLVAGNNDGDIIAVTGLQKQITSTNKLDADLVDDSESTNKFCTTSEKTSWDNAILPFYAVSESLATDVEKVISIPSITTLRTGQVVIVQPTATSTVANSTLKLNDFQAYPMIYNNSAITTSSDSKVWHANYPSFFVFNGSNWVFAGHGYDADTTYTINYSIDAGLYKSGTGNYAITRYSICMQKPDMTWEKVTATNKTHSTATSKSRNTSGFLLGQIRYYKDTTILANGAYASSDVMYDKNVSLDLRYSTNCGTSPSWVEGDYIYFVGTMGADGLFYLDTTWWTNTLPTTNDGKVYIQMGKALSSLYTMSIYPLHPVYYHDGVQLREYKVADNKQDKLANSTSTNINNNSVEINETWLDDYIQTKFGIQPIV